MTTWLAVISPLRRRLATASTALTGCGKELDIVVGVLVVVVVVGTAVVVVVVVVLSVVERLWYNVSSWPKTGR